MEESSKNDISSVLSPNQQRTISEIIFSGSSQKRNSRTSEKRYSKQAENFDTVDIQNQDESKSGKLLNYKVTKKPRHRRKSSAGEIQCENKATSCHSRNISDADLVNHRTEEKEKLSLRGSLPFLESTPCTTWCPYCKKQVHTVIEICSHSISKKILNIFASILSCCEAPVWLNNMRVHKCPECSLVLGKVGIIN